MENKINKLSELRDEVKHLLDDYISNTMKDIEEDEDSSEYDLALVNLLNVRAQLLTISPESIACKTDKNVQTIDSVKSKETVLILNDPLVAIEEPQFLLWKNVIVYSFAFLYNQLIVVITPGPSGNIVKIYDWNSLQQLSDIQCPQLSNPRGIISPMEGVLIISHYGSISNIKVRGILEFSMDHSRTKIWFTGRWIANKEDGLPMPFDSSNSKPTSVAYDPASRRLYVLDIGCSQVARFYYPTLTPLKQWSLGAGLLQNPAALCVGPSNVVGVTAVCVYEKSPDRVAIFDDINSTILMHINITSGSVLDIAWLPCGNLCILQDSFLTRSRIDIYRREVVRHMALDLPKLDQALAYAVGSLVPLKDNEGGLGIMLSSGVANSCLGRAKLPRIELTEI